ncbi:phenylacetic acid degradation protein PaaN [Fulvivirga sediminis]|uniref:Phenylacetic acid degradation protein PaaN n=1 Tax=Fulvivirga sediminis TaxID=2803949 RepID=A0A937F816_9BACT|nr:phenylacetic acid degradation protein PaaN [Fulvivirga sediminis]MBL3658026.1 phenylacetic acid degradation protein PaaN [Fulvivirga sediminis]
MDLFNKYKKLLEEAIKAVHERKFFAAFPEQPSPKIYGEDADEEGRKKYESHLGKRFEELLQQGRASWGGSEQSPYLQEPLNITYPVTPVDTLIANSEKAFEQWRKITLEDRAGILLESLEGVKNRFFEIAYATMHTTGQGYMMAFQASGPHAADRALEAIAVGYEELSRFPHSAFWDKPMGKFNIQLEKEWRAVPKGIGVVIGCSTFPTWNSVPGLFADLITANTVIAKPHPGAVLPMAIVIAEIQKVLKNNGLDPHICQLAIDDNASLISKELAENDKVKVIDFTGNSEFGAYLEGLKGKQVFTEKTGVNSVILDSADDIDKVAANLSFALCLYSGQMCTAPQNFYVPESGVDTPNGKVTFDEFAQKLKENIQQLIGNPKAAPFVLGAIQNEKTYKRLSDIERSNKVLLKSTTLENPMFKNARTATPVVLEVEAEDSDLYGKELFGPIALLIKTKSTAHSIQLAKDLAISQGAISCGAYTINPEVREEIADQMALAATPVSFNLTGAIYMNQNAGFSDFHVTGGNPAGNASFTNPEYVLRRFTWVGHREPARV